MGQLWPRMQQMTSYFWVSNSSFFTLNLKNITDNEIKLVSWNAYNMIYTKRKHVIFSKNRNVVVSFQEMLIVDISYLWMVKLSLMMWLRKRSFSNISHEMMYSLFYLFRMPLNIRICLSLVQKWWPLNKFLY